MKSSKNFPFQHFDTHHPLNNEINSEMTTTPEQIEIIKNEEDNMLTEMVPPGGDGIDYQAKRLKNNQSARRCREKRRMRMSSNLRDAKEAMEFNRYIRKELLQFYQTSNCPVPKNSMLLCESQSVSFLGTFIKTNI